MNTIRITPEQLAAAADWACSGPDMAAVTLIAGDSGLLQVRQGDDGTAFSADGQEQNDGDEQEGDGA